MISLNLNGFLNSVSVPRWTRTYYSCDLPLAYGGIAKVFPWSASFLDISKLRSPSTRSLWVNLSKNPHDDVRCYSETQTPQDLYIYIIAPVGLIATTKFTVLWLECISVLAEREVGLWIKTSEQSMLHFVLVYFSLR